MITSWQSLPLKESFAFQEDDFIICADGGYTHAKANGIVPHVVIGDFDSFNYCEIEKDLSDSGFQSRVLRSEVEKDETDTFICLSYGIDHGFDVFFIVGGLGGRLDHTMANIQTMSCAIDHDKSIWIIDGKNRATLRNPGSILIDNIEGYKFSLFAYGESCKGVTIKGAKYPLKNHRLDNSFPLGVSNEFADETVEISHTSGKLLIILSSD